MEDDMSEITIHYSILDAEEEDLVPIFGDDDESSSIPCLDLFFDSGTLELVHVGAVDDWSVTSEYARFAMRRPVDARRLHNSLHPGAELLRRFEVAHRAALTDSGLIGACDEITSCLAQLMTG
jgi:hypothetical protein